MLRTETVAPQLLNALHQLMEMQSLKNFRLVGGTALSLQLGHRQSKDIDLFSYNDFATEEICNAFKKKFGLQQKLKVAKGVMIVTHINDVKIDIVNDKNKFIRPAAVEDGIRMASLEEIAAMKIKIICDPFSGRKTKKDLADVACLLDKFNIKEMMGFFKEKYPRMAPYEEGVICQLNNFYPAEKTEMPMMLNDMTWEKTKEKIEGGLKKYFDDIIKKQEKKHKGKIK